MSNDLKSLTKEQLVQKLETAQKNNTGTFMAEQVEAMRQVTQRLEALNNLETNISEFTTKITAIEAKMSTFESAINAAVDNYNTKAELAEKAAEREEGIFSKHNLKVGAVVFVTTTVLAGGIILIRRWMSNGVVTEETVSMDQGPELAVANY